VGIEILNGSKVIENFPEKEKQLFWNLIITYSLFKLYLVDKPGYLVQL